MLTSPLPRDPTHTAAPPHTSKCSEARVWDTRRADTVFSQSCGREIVDIKQKFNFWKKLFKVFTSACARRDDRVDPCDFPALTRTCTVHDQTLIEVRDCYEHMLRNRSLGTFPVGASVVFHVDRRVSRSRRRSSRAPMPTAWLTRPLRVQLACTDVAHDVLTTRACLINVLECAGDMR